MGTQADNFESDGALDFLDSTYNEFIRLIRGCMSSDRLFQSDWFFEHYGEPRMIPALDILITLIEKYDVGPDSLESKEIKEWKKVYLEIYDGVIDQYTSKVEYKVERRRVIKDTFDKLIELVDDWHGD